MTSFKKGLSVVIITYNAARKLEECLTAVTWADEIIIVDSGSRDSTLEIAKKHGCKIRFREFDDFSSQKNHAISNASCEWILSLDADEIVTEELRKEIAAIVRDGSPRSGFFIERMNNIYGRFVKYGSPDLQLRLLKNGSGRFSGSVHERIFMKDSETGRLKGKLEHYTFENVSHHIQKIIEFTDYDVKFYPVEKIGPFWILRKLFFRPVGKFFQHYFFKKAYKDGRLGLLFTINTVMGEVVTHIKHIEKTLKKEKQL